MPDEFFLPLLYTLNVDLYDKRVSPDKGSRK